MGNTLCFILYKSCLSKRSNWKDSCGTEIMKKILIIDDEIDILCVTKLILTNHRFDVEILSTWEKIPETIQSYQPDLILLDVSLSGADGRDICTDLKKSEETEKIPIVLFSAHCDLINDLRGCQPNGVLSKPFETSDLINTIQNNLN